LKGVADARGEVSSIRRNGAIDELRGLAVLAVVCSHVGLVYGLDSPLAFGLAAPALGVGVDLFFVLSGYVIWQNVAAMRAKAGGDAVAGALAFWLRRFSRIALPAWATLAAIGVLRLCSGRDADWWSDLGAGAGFYANIYWAGCWTGEALCPDALMVSHFWSLALEAQFYALAPLLAGLGRREALCICALCLALGAVTSRPVGSFLWSVRPDGLLIGMTLSRCGPLGRLPGLGLGQAAYWLIVVAILVRFSELDFSGFGLASAAIVFGGILAARLKRGAAPGWAAAGLRKAGEASFSCYLVHLPVMTVVHAALAGKSPAEASLALAFFAVAAVTLACERAIVEPAAALSRRWSDGLILHCKYGVK
jgi:peptidoglycan/LPS O-acetylase OafA/YrhL